MLESDGNDQVASLNQFCSSSTPDGGPTRRLLRRPSHISIRRRPKVPNSLSFSPLKRIYAWLIASGVAMFFGHVLVMQSESGKDFTIQRTWVSQFAASHEFGWVIKIAIGLFCLALAELCGITIRRYSTHPHYRVLKFVWLTLTTFMIGGLVMVALYNIYDPDPGWIRGQVQALRDWWSGTSLGPAEGLHHSIGFFLFVSGFGLSASLLALLEWRFGNRDLLPTTCYLLLLAAALVAWLLVMRSQDSLPGIPQRALLVLVAVWVLRSASKMSR